MQATFTTPVTGATVAGVVILNVQISPQQGAVALSYQLVDGSNNAVGPVQSTQLSATQATAVINFLKTNLSTLLAAQLGSTIASVA